MHDILGVCTDSAQDAENRLNEKRALYEPTVEKMRQVVEVTYVIALEFKAGAVTGTSLQCVLDVLKGIPEYQIPAVLQVVALPWVSELLEAVQHRKQAKVH